MINHSFSHAAISVLSVMSAEFLAREISAAWPMLNGGIFHVSRWLAANVPAGLDPSAWNRALVALVMGLLWGGAFWVITIRPAMKAQQK